ncbi:hypothetical protein TSAR_012487, partial [Trichomalopsis sarcophagae]
MAHEKIFIRVQFDTLGETTNNYSQRLDEHLSGISNFRFRREWSFEDVKCATPSRIRLSWSTEKGHVSVNTDGAAQQTGDEARERVNHSSSFIGCRILVKKMTWNK